MKKYEQAIAWMEEKIRADGLKTGDRMPGEIEMAQTLGFSRQTIRQAVRVLEQRGILESIQGSGIYLSAPDSGAALPHPGKRYGNVAILSTYLDNYIFPGTVRGMQGVLSEHGYTARIELTNNHVMTERAILQHLLEADETDGLIVEAVKSALPNPNLEYYRQLRRKGVQIVFFNSFYPAAEFPCVRIDDVQSARDAVGLLLEAGRKKIAGIFKSDDGQGPLRYQGYLEALVRADAPVDEERILWLTSEIYRDFPAMEERIFAFLENADGVLCYNDELACCITDCAPRHGRSIPEDLSLVSIDDSYLAKLSAVPVTSFAHPKEELGKAAAEKLIRMIENAAEETDLVLQTRPVLRASV